VEQRGTPGNERKNSGAPEVRGTGRGCRSLLPPLPGRKSADHYPGSSAALHSRL